MKGNRVKDGILGLLVLLLAILISAGVFAGAAIWWLESRFGSDMAATTVGGTIGIFILLLGIGIEKLSNRSSQKNTVNMVRDIATTLKETVKVEGKLTAIDERRVDQLAQQRSKLLTDQQPTWLVQEPNQNEEIKVWK